MPPPREPPPAPERSAASYRRIIVEARERQLTQDAEHLRRLARLYDTAANRLVAELRNLPADAVDADGRLARQYVRQLVADMERILTNLRTDYAGQLEVAQLELAQAAAEREGQMALMNGQRDWWQTYIDGLFERHTVLSDGATVAVRYGRVAENAVRAVTDRYYRDGLKLSDRLYNLDKMARQTIEDTIATAVAEGLSVAQVASDLEVMLGKAGSANPAYHAERLARTEMNTVYREAHIRSTMNDQGVLNPWVTAVGWRLSLSHPEPDICDVWAAHDSGLGPGNYLPSNVPTDHPNGKCSTVTVIEDFKRESYYGLVPSPHEVPEVQVRYYADRMDDAVAAARLGA